MTATTEATATTAAVTDAYAEGAFEGPEKLLEIWFSPNAEAVSSQPTDVFGILGLRAVRREVWDAMLSVVRCQVLSVIHSPVVDAYLLSESSMFVYPHKLILKTCGTTILLKALPAILRIAARAGLDRVWRVFYSRKTFMFPERQEYPHRGWDDEEKYLNKLFTSGSSYLVGKITADHWYLYLTAPSENCLRAPIQLDKDPSPVEGDLLSQAGCTLTLADPSLTVDTLPSYVQTVPTAVDAGVPHLPEDDQTVEILMTELDPATADKFYHHAGESDGLEGGQRVDRLSGLCDIAPAAQLDSYLFQPCGYSLNALHDHSYFTVHVTPEPGYSYASFESNLPFRNCPTRLTALVQQVVDLFRPGKFSVTVFNSKSADTTDNPAGDHHRVTCQVGDLHGWRRNDRIHYEFEGYHLGFASFERTESTA